MKSCKIFVVVLCYSFSFCDWNLRKGRSELVFDTGQNASGS